MVDTDTVPEMAGCEEMLIVPVKTDTVPLTAAESATRTMSPNTLAATDPVEPCNAWPTPAVVPVMDTATAIDEPPMMETVPDTAGCDEMEIVPVRTVTVPDTAAES